MSVNKSLILISRNRGRKKAIHGWTNQISEHDSKSYIRNVHSLINPKP